MFEDKKPFLLYPLVSDPLYNSVYFLPLYTTGVTGQGVRSWLAIGQRFPDGHLDTKRKQNRKSGSECRKGKYGEMETCLER